MLSLRTNLTEKTMRVAEGRANKVLTFCATAMVAMLLGLLLAANPAHASTFTVNSAGDENDLDFPGGEFDGSSDGKCDVDSSTAENQCTLRAAIQQANATTSGDTIKFNIPASTDTGCNATSRVCTISPSSGLPEIINPVIIDGYSQGKATADPADNARPNTLAVGDNAVLKIELSGASIPAETPASGLTIKAAKSTVKGLVISNWEEVTSNSYGVYLDSGATGNKVQGNFIGTNAAGDTSLGNSSGVLINNAPNNTIGGTNAAARNIISGNRAYGVYIYNGATGNKVQGNYIGSKANGTEPLGNGESGVSIQGGVANNTVGGTEAKAGNIISFNGFNGVEIGDDYVAATGNRILYNSIYENAQLGIDLFHPLLGDRGVVNTNDPGDPDTDGPNHLQNWPAITSAAKSGSNTLIEGTLNSSATTKFIIQFFSSPDKDPGGYGEGQKLIGQKSVTTDASGNVSFTATTPVVPAGQFVTATATDPDGNTSEFSEVVAVS